LPFDDRLADKIENTRSVIPLNQFMARDYWTTVVYGFSVIGVGMAVCRRLGDVFGTSCSTIIGEPFPSVLSHGGW